MSVRSICKSFVVTVSKGATLKEAAHLMQKNHVGSLVVIDSINGKRIPSGIITDRDIALSLGSSQRPQDLIVENIMRSHPVTIKASEGIFEAVIKMREHGVRRLPVINDDGSLCGILSADDLFSLLGEELNTLSRAKENQLKREQGVHTPMESPYLA